MRTRLLLAALLTLGLLFTVNGALAIAEHTPGHNDAGAQQYGGEDDEDDGTRGSGGGGFENGVGGGDGTTFFADAGGGGDGTGGGGGVSAGDQSAASDGTGLALTGFLAIPLLLLGVAMLGAGAFVGVKARKA